MVMYTSGYYVSQNPSRSEPTQIVDGNQLSMEYRYFEPSRPAATNWPKQLTIKQAATDQHRIVQSFQRLYTANWLTTGGSKGGMTATYHRRFFPNDVQGTVPYVAPNDVRNDRDVYASFLANVGTDPQCRQDLLGVQRRILGPDRAWFLDRTRASAEEQGETWEIPGSLDRAMEVAAMDLYFTFWQYSPQSACAGVPAAGATNEEIWDWTQGVVPLTGYMDSSLEFYAPYYYQAAYQLGWYQTLVAPLRDVVRYGNDPVAAPRLIRANSGRWTSTSRRCPTSTAGSAPSPPGCSTSTAATTRGAPRRSRAARPGRPSGSARCTSSPAAPTAPASPSCRRRSGSPRSPPSSGGPGSPPTTRRCGRCSAPASRPRAARSTDGSRSASGVP